MIRKIGLASMIAGFALAAPGPASAATTLGETFVPESCGTDTYIQTADPGNRYMVPFDGVITQWSYRSDSTPPAGIRFKVGRTAAYADLSMDTNVTIVGQSATETLVPDALNTYGTQIPVKAGDRIGEFIPADCSRFDPSYTDHYFNADVQPGDTELFTHETYQQDISAVLEPDCDHDGLGDETQDPDILSCKPPATGQRAAALKKCKKKHKKALERKTANHTLTPQVKKQLNKKFKKCKKKANLLPL
jgi:hypothetical protein